MSNIKEIVRNLCERVPAHVIKTRKQGGTSISYITWHDACDLLDERSPGWECRITAQGSEAGKVFVRVALTIEGITRENIGYEEEEKSGYGDPFSNAFAMALKRAAALFGLGRHLYDKDDKPHTKPAITPQAPKPPSRAWLCSEGNKKSIVHLSKLLNDEYEVSYAEQRESLREHLNVESPSLLNDEGASFYIEQLQTLLDYCARKKREGQGAQ